MTGWRNSDAELAAVDGGVGGSHVRAKAEPESLADLLSGAGGG